MKNLTAVTEHLEQHIQNVMQQGGIGGLAFAITDRECLLAVGTAGLADIAAQQPVTPDISLPSKEREALAPRGAFLNAYGYETHFEICSITKSLDNGAA